MSPETAEVARMLVPDRQWSWRGHRTPQGWANDGATSRSRDGVKWVWSEGRWVPDLDDGPTVGALQHMLVTTPGVVDMEVRFSASTGWWHVWVQCADVRFFKRAGPTLGGCVARTLLAVWEAEPVTPR